MKKYKFILALIFCSIFSVCLFVGCGYYINDNTEENQTVFTVTVKQNEHGIVAVDKTSAEEDEIITVLTQPENGYSLYVILCDGVVVDGNTITMPNKDIVVSAIFKQISNDVTLTQGNYVLIADAHKGGCRNVFESFVSTVTVRENNLIDVFLRLYVDYVGYQLVVLDDVAYTQEDRVITASVFGFDYSVYIVDNKTFIVNDPNENYLQIFCYNDDMHLSEGEFKATIDDSEIQLNVKSDSTLDIIKTTAGEEELHEENLNYFVKGSNLFIDLGDEYLCVKLWGTDSNRIAVKYIIIVSKTESETIIINETDYIDFDKITQD